MYMAILPVRMLAIHLHAVPKGTREGIKSSVTGLQMAVSCRVDSGNQIWIYCKNNNCS